MKKLNGFTLIEILIVIAILGVLAAIIVPAITGTRHSGELSMGINGVAESRCIQGYQFVVGRDGSTRQIMDENGRGVRCTTM